MKKISPIDQALSVLELDHQKHILMQNIEPLNEQARVDLCLAIVAYQRFKIKRPFSNPLLQVIYTSFIEIL